MLMKASTLLPEPSPQSRKLSLKRKNSEILSLKGDSTRHLVMDHTFITGLWGSCFKHLVGSGRLGKDNKSNETWDNFEAGDGAEGTKLRKHRAKSPVSATCIMTREWEEPHEPLQKGVKGRKSG